MARAPRSQPLQADAQPLRSRARKPRDPSQPKLPLDPMPARIEPCLALLKPRPPIGPDWTYEVKWDGYRIALHLNNGNVRILTRGGHDWTHRFPGIEEAAKRLGVGTAILDGEAVVLDEEGRPDFGRLQNSLGGRGGKLPAGNAIMFAFDLLYFDGHDIRNMELSSRRFFLESLLRNEEGAIRLSDEVDGDGREIFAAAYEHGLEGIIAKHKDSTYRSGRLGDWIKVKCVQSDSFMIVGYEHSLSARGGIGSLLLAARKEGKLVYVGSVGTGFSELTAQHLRTTLDRIKRKSSPIEYGGRRRVVWVQPTLIAEIEYRAWTHDGKLRHSSYKGLREVQDNAAVYELV
ncbi:MULTISPECIES: non-homologous end-joining DNA ligase [Rhizobium]|uniref:DNA ligase (ATP) n=1 Tax=Rhizobium favelukesii TaxID=348824 RepID=W6R4Q1_9HYPH|nr:MULTISPECIES: non-homologous end-joining DNA ligase [Rhizobium]UFS82015.1 non-homologous end-joining DNA ligase [Rhizobium sp. T136]CDM56307.1 DNA polymerase LigD, ligase domain protein [Rhizobium favelukesii]